MDPDFPWSELGLTPTSDMGAIRRAYAQRLKTIDRTTDAAGFQALRRAYEAALAAASGSTLEPKPQAAHSPSEPAPGPADAVLQEFARLGERGKVAEAMAVLERFERDETVPLDRRTPLEVRLFSLVMDDPLMPPALLAALAEHFRWTEVGSALEEQRPDLYDRYIHRMGVAFAWLQEAKTLAERKDLAGATARRIFLHLSLRSRLLGVLRVDRGLLENLLRDARRFGPLLAGAIDPNMTEYLGNRLKGPRSFLGIYIWILLRQPAFVAVVALCILAIPVRFFGPRWLQQQFGLAPPLPSDPKAELLESPERWVEFNGWKPQPQAFGSKPYLLVYFTPILGSRQVIAEIRYGIDADRPDKTFDFPRDPSIPEGSLPIDVELPLKSRFVTVQIRFNDGTTSPVQRFDVPERLRQ